MLAQAIIDDAVLADLAKVLAHNVGKPSMRIVRCKCHANHRYAKEDATALAYRLAPLIEAELDRGHYPPEEQISVIKRSSLKQDLISFLS